MSVKCVFLAGEWEAGSGSALAPESWLCVQNQNERSKSSVGRCTFHVAPDSSAGSGPGLPLGQISVESPSRPSSLPPPGSPEHAWSPGLTQCCTTQVKGTWLRAVGVGLGEERV